MKHVVAMVEWRENSYPYMTCEMIHPPVVLAKECLGWSEYVSRQYCGSCHSYA